MVSKRDLNPRVKDYNGNTALSIALKRGYRDIAKTLILLGCEPLLGEKTVLDQWFSAARVGNVDTIESMLDTLSFPIDMIDNEDMTALMLACSNGHIKLVQYLLQRGANVNIQGHRGYTALMFAIENGKILIFHELIQLNDILIGLEGDDGRTILMCAARGGMPEVVRVALPSNDTGVDINATNFDGNTALMIACRYNSASVATQLLRNHCDLDIKNKLQQNALIICAMYGSPQIAAMLCTLGSNIDFQDNEGKTALIYAAMKGDTGIVVNLIKYGADINIVDNQGLNALEYANKNGKFEIVKMIKSGTLQDVTDILQQMEILKQKNKALSKNVLQLTEMNNELSDRVNATELAKNQIQKKLQDTVSRMKTQFSIRGKSTSPPSQSRSPSTNKMSSPKEKMSFPKMNVNLKDTFSGMKTGMTGMMNKFNAQFHDHNSNNSQKSSSKTKPSSSSSPQIMQTTRGPPPSQPPQGQQQQGQQQMVKQRISTGSNPIPSFDTMTPIEGIVLNPMRRKHGRGTIRYKWKRKRRKKHHHDEGKNEEQQNDEFEEFEEEKTVEYDYDQKANWQRSIFLTEGDRVRLFFRQINEEDAQLAYVALLDPVYKQRRYGECYYYHPTKSYYLRNNYGNQYIELWPYHIVDKNPPPNFI